MAATATRQTRDWPDVIQRQEASGKSVNEFCAQEKPKLSAQAFYTAKKRLKAASAGNGRGRTQPRFTPAQLIPKTGIIGGAPISLSVPFDMAAAMSAADTLRLICRGNIQQAVAILNSVAGLPTG